MANPQYPPMTKSQRKAARRLRNEEPARTAREWRGYQIALGKGYDKPINRQAAKDLNHNN